MKICVTANGSGPEAAVDKRFGRCSHFVIVDPDTMESESMENNNSSASGGAGVRAAQDVIGKGVDVLITGNVGPNAFDLLSSADVDMRMSSSGSVLEAIEAYRSGLLDAINIANSPGKQNARRRQRGSG